MHRLADTNTRSKRDKAAREWSTGMSQATSDPDIRAAVFSLLRARIHAYLSHYRLHRMQIITGRVPVARYPGGRTRTRMRAHTHAQYPPLSAHIATGIQVDGIARHSSPPWLPLERFFHPFNRSHRFYPRKGDKARCHLRISMRFSASAKVGVSRDDGRHRDDSKWLLCWDFILYSTTCYCCAFRCFFLFLSGVDIFREGTNLRSERILKRVL